jgi:hypothetical protein
VKVSSKKLHPILKISNKILGKKSASERIKDELRQQLSPEIALKELSSEENFEFIYAPAFVLRTFKERFHGATNTIFSPFELPNLLIVSSKTNLELYAYFSPKDHYCVLVGCNKQLEEYGPYLKQLIFEMKDHGISYIEILIKLDCDSTIEYLLQNHFLPSALCPALVHSGDTYYDYIFLSRTMQPLDFSGMQIDSSFSPFINQYIDLWIDMHVKAVKILDHGQLSKPTINS